MIVKIINSGASFAEGAHYAMHDRNGLTNERVAWTHTENLANNSVDEAVKEMEATYENADILKQQAGVHAGGRRCEQPMKHISLNWDPADNPSQAHMIATGKHFMKSMGWSEYQVIYVAHDDKQYKHVHLIINKIHPETGRTLNDGWEKNRAQKWADAYERENGIRCPQRQLHPDVRQKSMPRNIWMAFQNNELEFEKSEQQLRLSEFAAEYRKGDEWKIFNEIQRNERMQFFAEGKSKFKQIRNQFYQEVHGEFRERWADYYKAEKNTAGEDVRFIKATKKQLVADEKARLEPVRDAACKQLRKERDAEYDSLLADQRLVRAEFRDRLEMGLDNADFFRDLADRKTSTHEIQSAFGKAKAEMTGRAPQALETAGSSGSERSRAEPEAEPPAAKERDIASVGARRAVASVGSFLDALFFDLTTLGSAPPSHERDGGTRDLFEINAEEATKRLQQEQQLQYDEEWRTRSKQSYGE